MELTPQQILSVRRRWREDPSYLGFPDAERDADEDRQRWLHHLLVRPTWFGAATDPAATLIIGRKGVGKSAAKIAAVSAADVKGDVLVVQASADELAARHADRLRNAAERGYGAVADWCHVFAELIVRHVATNLAGTVITGDDEAAIRKWATLDGISERDFGERVASAIKSVVPWAQKLIDERGDRGLQSEARIRRVADTNKFSLYIDDFDNLQDDRTLANLRLIRDAVEAADRITHSNKKASVHLLMRQDLWLRLRPGWHYEDKIAGSVELNWTQENLRSWAHRRLRVAAARALGIDPAELATMQFHSLWSLFFPTEVVLRNEKESEGLHYIVRRTMYTPRGLRKFLALIMQRARTLPADLGVVEDAEREFSVDQMGFVITEFGGLCDGLDICVRSFTGRPMEWRATALYKHLNGMIGNGQVRLHPGASGGDDAIALARFLFRIGFLEVRYDDGQRFEVRDAMRSPDFWNSVRKDDAIMWAVRSAFYLALRTR